MAAYIAKNDWFFWLCSNVQIVYCREDFCIIFHKLIHFCEKLKEKEEENSDSRAKNNLKILLEKTENGFHSTRGLFSVEVWVEYLGRT